MQKIVELFCRNDLEYWIGRTKFDGQSRVIRVLRSRRLLWTRWLGATEMMTGWIHTRHKLDRQPTEAEIDERLTVVSVRPFCQDERANSVADEFDVCRIH